MIDNTLFINKRLNVSNEPPYDALQSFVRDNHIALHGNNQGLLSDYVFSAKDVFKIKGSTWGNGHPDWLRYSAPDDFTASAVEKLLENGADLVGKTVCDELCYSISGENWNYGSPINPHDVRRYAGGSSSGSCVSVAGGLVDFSIGSDCLGSVRVPAAYNGLLGMRPTYKRVDNTGEAPYCESMDVLGFVADNSQTFQDVAQVLLGEDQKEYQFDKLLIAEDCFEIIDQDTKTAIEPALETLKNYVSEVEYKPISNDLSEWVRIFQIVQGYEVWESYGGFVNKYNPKLSPGPKSRLQFASKITLNDYKEHLKKKDEIQLIMDELVPEGTLLVMPTASSVAPLKSANQEDINESRAQSSKLLCVSPLAGLPQITLPLVKHDGVPLGISIIGSKGSDMAMVKLVTKIMQKEIEG